MRQVFLVVGLVFGLVSGAQSETAGPQQLEVGEAKRIQQQDSNNSRIALISAQYETSPNEEIIVPFVASNTVSSSPRLNMSFIVKSRGHCHVTYEDTEISLNEQVIETLDFREYEDEQVVSIDIPLPVSLIRNGNNELRIAMGACDYDIDTMQLNQTTLVF